MIEIIPNWHPLFVHFTVTILLITGVLQILQWLFKVKLQGDSIASAQKWLVILGSLAVVLTLATGLQAYYSVNHDTPSHLAMTDHRNWAVITAIAFLLGAVFYFLFPKTKQTLAGGLFVIASLLLSVTAYKGGELVFRHGIGVMSMPVVTGDGHDHDHDSEDEPIKNPASANTPASDDGHSGHDHEPAAEAPPEVKKDDHGGHDHENTEAKEPPIELESDHGEHDHGDETNAQRGQDPDSQEFFTGIETDAAQAVIAFHDAIDNGDSDRARSYLEGAIIIFEGGGVERSADEYASHHMISDMSFLNGLTITGLEHQVIVDGNMAVSISRSKMQGVFKDKEIDMQSMETMVLKRKNDQWKIIHIHWSN